MVLNSQVTVLFAHGAGAGSDSEFITSLQTLMHARGVDFRCFDFPYMQLIQQQGRNRPPDKMPVLQQAMLRQLEEIHGSQPVFLAGKSMGGRVASMLLNTPGVSGGMCLGYPFHPPGKLDKLRIEHLTGLTKPLLIVQGERDVFGTRQQIEEYPLSSMVQVNYLSAGDHSFVPTKRSGITWQQHMQQAADWMVEFIEAIA